MLQVGFQVRIKKNDYTEKYEWANQVGTITSHSDLMEYDWKVTFKGRNRWDYFTSDELEVINEEI